MSIDHVMSRLLLPLALPLALPFATTALPVRAQDWQLVQPPLLPTPAESPRMAFDAQRGEIVLFGGYDNRANSWPPRRALAETWLLANGQWTRRQPAASPPGRGQHAMAWHPVLRTVVLFGGRDANGSPLNDVWEWDGVTWSTIYRSHAPAPRMHAAMAFDGSQMVVHGGQAPPYPFTWYGDTWRWDRATGWQLVTVNGPGPRANHAMANTELRLPWVAQPGPGVVLHGGRSATVNQLADTWLLADGASVWQPVPNANAPARELHQLAWDPASRQVFLCSGHWLPPTGYADDLWRFDGQRWFEVRTRTRPTPTMDAAVAMDTARNRLVLFGGAIPYQHGTVGYEHFEFGSTVPVTRLGAPCSASAASMAASCTLPLLGSTWRVDLSGQLPSYQSFALLALGFGDTAWNGQPLPQPLAFLGLPQCSLRVEPTLVRVLPMNGGAAASASFTLPIPATATLSGVALFAQALAVDAAGAQAVTEGLRVGVY